MGFHNFVMPKGRDVGHMSSEQVRYLKADRGRWYYRRRVPLKYQKTLGITLWKRPCGDVSYQKAVVLVTQWAEQHDALLTKLKSDPTFSDQMRRYTSESTIWTHADSLVELVHKTQTDPNAVEEVSIQKGNPFVSNQVRFDPLDVAIEGLSSTDNDESLDRFEKLARYKSLLQASFGDHVEVPPGADERDEYELVRRKLERRVSSIAGDPNTVSAVSERYFDFVGITPQVRNKYTRIIQTLIKHVGDVPLGHLSASQLRAFRDKQSKMMQPASLASLFTPIRGMFNFAVENEIVELNPMGSIKMPKEKRSVQMRKWKPFSPEEAQKIFQAMDEIWDRPLRGLSKERRLAIHMVVRVQAFTCMRPKEVINLRPENVTDKWIKVVHSKTEGSDRTIPLHPEIKDFPAFFHAGGFDTFRSQKKDMVQTVRHNFSKLIRVYMELPILDEKKVLYSWRSTFSNAMRRAGADGEMRRAILGHAEAGALKHYDDGPEFAKKRKWVRASDPRTVYDDAGEDDDLD